MMRKVFLFLCVVILFSGVSSCKSGCDCPAYSMEEKVKNLQDGEQFFEQIPELAIVECN
ncbi:MAG: hypothetical protein ACK5IJ_09240 [Mangrovibacterium sp.]